MASHCESASLEREALEFIYQLQDAYLTRRDMEELLDKMEERTSWIGTGKGEACGNLEEARAALRQEFEEYPGRFEVLDTDLRACALSENVCVVFGAFVAKPERQEIDNLSNRVSAVCVKTEHGMRLAHLHLSRPDCDQKEGNFYVRRGTAKERQSLKERAAESERRLRLREQELRALTENIPGGIHQCLYDEHFTLISATSGFLSLVGYTRAEVESVFHNHFAEMIYEEDRQGVRETMKRQLLRQDTVELEYRVRKKDGSLLWILDKGKKMVMPDGAETFYCMLIDITRQKEEREQLRLSLERHEIIMDQATDIIFEWDIKRDTLNFSANWSKKFGYLPICREISRSIPFSENIHPEDMPAFIKIMNDTAAGVSYSEAEFRIRDTSGSFRWCRIRATVQYDGMGSPIKAVGVIVDIDIDKKQRQLLQEQAQKDSLTGLLNKAAARHAVEEAISYLGDEQGILFIIDLDNFKSVNDSCGHLCGDAVLSDTAAELKKRLRATDILARIGGDEFLAFLPGASPEDAGTKAHEILEAISGISVGDVTGLVSCSIGAAVYPVDGGEFLSLYRCADMALYQIKKNGKNGCGFWSAQLSMDGPNEETVRSAVNSVIDSETEVVNEKLGQYCFQMLYRASDPKTAIRQILEIVGRSCDVSRVRIFENSDDGSTCSNTYEWCAAGVCQEMACLQNLSCQNEFPDYAGRFDQDGIFYCRDIRTLDSGLYELLRGQGICSFLQCAILDGETFLGFIGFEECRNKRAWTKSQIKTLSLVANVISTFLIKIRLQESVERMLLVTE